MGDGRGQGKEEDMGGEKSTERIKEQGAAYEEEGSKIKEGKRRRRAWEMKHVT